MKNREEKREIHTIISIMSVIWGGGEWWQQEAMDHSRLVLLIINDGTINKWWCCKWYLLLIGVKYEEEPEREIKLNQAGN